MTLVSFNTAPPVQLNESITVAGLPYSGSARFDVLPQLGGVVAPEPPAFDQNTEQAPVWNGEGWDAPTPLPQEILDAKLAAAKAKLISDAASGVQAHLDAGVLSRNYDGILSACTYANSTNAIFAAEGQACVKWRDDVWTLCYALLAEITAGTRQVLTVDELIDLLPPLEWPDAPQA